MKIVSLFMITIGIVFAISYVYIRSTVYYSSDLTYWPSIIWISVSFIGFALYYIQLKTSK